MVKFQKKHCKVIEKHDLYKAGVERAAVELKRLE